jgi:hypothetical protein
MSIREIKSKTVCLVYNASNLANPVELILTTTKNINYLGRRYTGESSECSSIVGTPTTTESGRCFTFTAAQRILRNNDERKPSVNQNLAEMLLDVRVWRLIKTGLSIWEKRKRQLVNEN